jgi:AbrB family looped-hinge helix DNA binding protein
MPVTHFAEARVTSKGQITLPKKVKNLLGAERGDYILFIREDHRMYIEVGRLILKSRK